MTIEIPRGEVFGFTGTHQALHLFCRSVRRRWSTFKAVAEAGSAARDYDAATVTVAPASDSSSFSVTVR